MTETIELERDTLKKLLRMYIDGTELLEAVPEMQDQGRMSEVSQHIGAELEARTNMLNEAEKQDPVITDILKEIGSGGSKTEETLEELEEKVLGE